MSFSKFPSLGERRCAADGFSCYVFFALKLAGIRRRVCVLPSKLGAFIHIMSRFADGGFFFAMTCCPEAQAMFYPRRQCQEKVRRALLWFVMIWRAARPSCYFKETFHCLVGCSEMLLSVFTSACEGAIARMRGRILLRAYFGDPLRRHELLRRGD